MLRRLLTPRRVADASSLAGLTVLTVGIALVYVPAALIVLGVGLMLLGLLVDPDPKRRR